ARALPAIPTARSAEPSVTADPGGLTPLPRRVPQTSLASELREEAGPAEEDEELEDFTAERAASSLAGFQRGTFQARDSIDDDAPSQYDREEAAASSNPPADRS
ncbi:histidine kinase, partial [Streptomyces sp. W16]|nr:histidine kinase [Streptomyces sp. W16]